MSRGSSDALDPSDASDPPGPGGRDSRPQVLSGVRVTHDRASIDVLEAVTRADPRDRLLDLLSHDGVSEAAVLQTCNRVEEYVVAETADRGRAALADFGADLPEDVVVAMGHGESLRHLLSVAAGLESQVLGEDQILGQVRETYAAAMEADALGPVLENGLLKAIHVGERARSETAINEGIVSLGSAAADLIERERGFDGRTVVVGAGEVAGTVVSALAERGARDLCVLNRSEERAAALAASVDVGGEADADGELDVQWAGLRDLDAHLRAADVVVASTGSDAPVIGPDSLSKAGRTFVVDLGQPRDVDPGAAELAGVDLHDLDDLRAVTRRTHEDRREAAAEVEAIVDAEYERLIESYKRKRADSVVRGMYRGAEAIKERELARALSKLDGLDEDEREVVRGLADAIVSRLLAVPTESLRDAAANDDLETLLAAIELFDPGLEEDTEDLFADLPDALVESGALDGAPVSEGSED